MTGPQKFLIVAYSGQGHINPSLLFAHRLLKMGIDVTFATSFSVIRHFDKKTTARGLTFAPFSDGHDNGMQPTTSLEQFVYDFSTKGSYAVSELINSATSKGQPFDHLVYTTVAPWGSTVAKAHNIKSTLLWCQPATILDIYYYYFNGHKDLISSNNNNTAFQVNFPGLPPLTIADLPSFFLPTNPKEHDFLIPLFKDHIDALKTSPRILINTFDSLEVEPLRAIDKIKFFPIGPLIPPDLLDGKQLSENLPSYIHWLNTKSKSSVVYVSFGSITNLSNNQAEEMSIGLLETRRPFLWVIRDSEQACKLQNIEQLKKQGMIVNWCSQVEVLRHESIGCFVTHCGWNSTLETIVGGVPLVAFPQWTDQGTNAKLIEDVWKIGVKVSKRDIDGIVEGHEIERCVEIVMKDEKMKKNIEKWSKLAKESLNKDDGSSIINLQTFLNDA
ncbi:UDP-glycosyltransferase 75C1-like [Rutidosis leptorrhynchoides]|uniref:UDP-glycosyltransferase 75C1-like n=1 Tax=Rutidosis leptorrhynchoides TaxID=125765 RepID=UPI003A993603